MDVVGTKKLEGGLGVVKGLRVTGISAGFRRNPNRRDMALICAPSGSTAAGVFTQSNFAAAPVHVSREHLALQASGQDFRALIINSGNANAATGAQGLQLAEQVCETLAEAIDCKPAEVLVASTGVIGAQLGFGPFEKGIPLALSQLSSGDGKSVEQGLACAEAIMTTDTIVKVAARAFTVQTSDGSELTYSVGGMAKGSGMIAPHMATLICVMATDAQIGQPALAQALKAAVDVSYNKVTIDSDTSTNDSAYLLATAAVGDAALEPGTPAFAAFQVALTEVCQELAYLMAGDGEGASKLVIVDVWGALNDDEADRVARAIADSPLVKTAVAGHDANWGRIAMAAGKVGATFEPEDVSISIMDLEVFVKGTPIEFSEDEALKRFEERDEILLSIDLGAGEAKTRIWTCDLTKEYVAINGDYRS